MFIVDLLSPKGHRAINRFFLNAIPGNVECGTLYAKQSYLDLCPRTFQFLRVPQLTRKDAQGLLSHIEVLWASIFLLSVIPKVDRPRKRVLFLSYNCANHIPIFIFLRILGYRIYVFEHNSIPRVESSIKSRFKEFLFERASRMVTHIVFEDYIKLYLESRFLASVIVVRHPCLGDRDPNFSLDPVNPAPFIFSPSASTTENWLVPIVQFARSENKTMYLKNTGFQPSAPGVVRSSFFSNYYNILSQSDVIVLGCDFQYRVSGVFYESLRFNKKIVMSDSVFSRAVVKMYPNVYILESGEEVRQVIMSALYTPNRSFDSDSHNRTCADSFASIFYV